MTAVESIGVIGGGAWGTALAQVAAAGGRDVLLWAREDEVVGAINNGHENTAFLPGVPLAESIRATQDLAALSTRDALLVVAPAQHVRTVLTQVVQCGQPLVLCAKGIEAGSMKLLTEVAAEVQPASPIAVLSGPTFAHEVAAGLPTAVTLAAGDEELAQAIMTRLALPAFRPYWSDDLVGAEIGGAVKNVLAIACGVVEGRGLGQNARSALISRGFAEMQRFGVARGARPETLAGLSGLGDLMLTCSSSQSRNYSYGLALGRGEDLTNRPLAEGVATAPIAAELCRKHAISAPIIDATGALLDGTITIDEAVTALLNRPLKTED